MVLSKFKALIGGSLLLAGPAALGGTFSVVGASLSFTAGDSTQSATGAAASNDYTLTYGISYYLNVSMNYVPLTHWEGIIHSPLGNTPTGTPDGGGEEAMAPVQQWTIQWVPAPGETSPPGDWDVDFEFYGTAYASVVNASPVAGTFSGDTTVTTIDGITADALLTGTGTETGGSSSPQRFSDDIVDGGAWTEVSAGVWQSTVQLTANASIQISWQDQPTAVSVAPSTVDQDPLLNIEVRPIYVSGQSVEPII